MPYDPSQPVPIKVELQINGVWTDITARGRSAGSVRVKHALSDGARQPETSTLDIRVGNDDGYLTEDDPRSPWYPYVGRGTPIRVTLAGILPSDAGRFAGKIDRMEAVYPGGGSSAMDIEAIGTWGDLASNDDPVRSAMFYSMSGVTPGDSQPHAYWPLEDESGATAAASGLVSGAPMYVSGPAAFANDSGVVGSAPLLTLNPGATCTAVIPPYTDTGSWYLQILVKVPSEPAALAPLVEIDAVGGTVATWRLEIEPGSPTTVWWRGYDSSGVAGEPTVGFLLSGLPGGITEEQFYGRWILYTLGSFQDTSDDTLLGPAWLNDADGVVNLVGLGGVIGAGDHGRATDLRLHAATGASFGHATFFADTALIFTPQITEVVGAMTGWTGESVGDRIDRLRRELQLPITVIGEATTPMGPQPRGKITDVLTDCQKVDLGLWSDDRSDIGLTYRTRLHLYNQDSGISIVYGSLTPDTKPVWDFQQVRNQWTITREGGSSATESDEDHVARVQRRIKDSDTINTASDGVLREHARWLVRVGAVPDPRYPTLGINLRNSDGALLADSVLEADAGHRLVAEAAAFPVQHPPAGADQMVVGWEELLDADEWQWRPVAVPFGPYMVGVAGDGATPGAWLQTGEGTKLAALLAIGATSLSVTVDGPLFSTDPADLTYSPLELVFGGEIAPVVSITGAASPQTIVVQRTVAKAHASDTPVQVHRAAVAAY